MKEKEQDEYYSMRLHYEEGLLHLSFPYSEETIITCKTLSGRWSKASHSWTFQPSQILRLMEVFNLGEEDLTSHAKALRDGAKILAEKRETVREVKSETKNVKLELPNNFTFITEPYEHQKTAFILASKFNAFALLMEMGTGKTKVALDLFRWRHNIGQVTKAIVICPKSVISVWQNEVPKHSFLTEKNLVVLPNEIKGGKKKREEVLETFFSEKNSKIVILNYESLLTFPKTSVIFNAHDVLKQTMLILDESTRVKTPTAQRTKLTHILSKSIPYRLILSGLLIPNNLLDIYSQWYCIDHGEAFGQTFSAFKRSYFIPDRFGYTYFPKKSTKDYIVKVIEGQGYRVRKAECLDLPPKVYEKRIVEMTPSQKRIYIDIAENLIAEIEQDKVTCNIALTKLIKLAEITSGFVISNLGKLLTLENPKLDALIELLEEIGENQKAVIFAIHKHSIRSIESSLNKLREGSALTLFGETSSNAKEIVEKFQNRPDIKYLVAHPGSGGLGITLTAAKYTIYYSSDFNLENRLQSEDRMHRIGSEKHDKITYVDLVCPRTIDEAILKALSKKKDMMSSVIDYRKLITGELA